MQFSPELVAKVLSGSKTVTRRRLRDGQPIRYQVGKVYAVQPGRGKHHVGHIKVTRVWRARLRDMEAYDALCEGFGSVKEFARCWLGLHGNWDPYETVAVIEFELADPCPDCQPLAGGS